MNYEEIIDIIERENHYNDEYYEYYEDDEYDEEFKKNLYRGIFLKDTLNTINLIQEFFYEQLKEQDIDVDYNDIFLFLKIQEQLSEDYSNLRNEINVNISEIDYGGCTFVSEDEDFNKLKGKIESLYDEFKSIDII